MITSLYQSLCNMETNIADRVALRWYDEEKSRVLPRCTTHSMPRICAGSWRSCVQSMATCAASV